MSDQTPAPDLPTLLQFEANIEPAFVQRLHQLGVDRAQAQQGTGDQASGRVDVELVMGSARGDTMHIPADLDDGVDDSRACYENAWNARFSFRVITVRDQNGQLHRAYVGIVRALMLRFFQEFPPELLPWYEIALVQSAGTRPGLVSDKEEDVTILDYAGVIAIRDGAWPA